MALHPLFQKICEAFGAPPASRPPEPPKSDTVWYRGWECSYDATAAFWSGEGWNAYMGGCDLDAPHNSARTWEALLDEIDAEEDD